MFWCVLGILATKTLSQLFELIEGSWFYLVAGERIRNRAIRKSIKTRGSFPTDKAAKLIYLAI